MLKLTKSHVHGEAKLDKTMASEPYQNAVGFIMYPIVGDFSDLGDAVRVLG